MLCFPMPDDEADPTRAGPAVLARADPAAPGLRLASRAGRLALVASILGSGMAFLDSTAVNVALPTIGDELGAGFAAFQWVVNGYMVTLGSLVLLGGSLADLWGRRRLFLLGVAWFGAASAACGLAPGVGWLIAFRVLQGVGAALLVPSSLAMIQAGFAPDERGRAIGLWSGFSGLSTLVGPLLGGWLIDAVSWRAVFLINPVLAAATLWLAWRHVPAVPGTGGRRPDVAGAAAAVVALGAAVYALIQGPEAGWGDAAVLAAGALALAATAAFFVIESRERDPMLPLDFFRRRRFAGANGTTLLVYFVLSGVFFLLTIELQRVLGYSALAAGAAAAPITLLLLVLSPRAGRFADRHGPRLPMTVGPVLAAGGTALLTRVHPTSGYVAGVLPGILVFGLGLGCMVAPLTAAALAALDDAHSGLASGVNNAVARVAQTLGVAVLPLAAGISAAGRARGPAFDAGFHVAMWIGAAIMLAGGAVAWLTICGATRSES